VNVSGTVLDRPRVLGPAPLPVWTGVLRGRSRRHLAETLGAYAPPSRIVCAERDPAPPVDLEQVFPDATVWEGTLAPRPEWSGWPDLLWLGFALSARDVDVDEALAVAWRALPAGALVACVDLCGAQPSVGTELSRRLGLDPSRDTLGPLRRAFVPLELTVHADPDDRWRTYAFVGTKRR
jgi:hypothetical protein